MHVKDITGQRFSKLVCFKIYEMLIKAEVDVALPMRLWEQVTVASCYLVHGKSSCGCSYRISDITGMRFGKLLVIKI